MAVVLLLAGLALLLVGAEILVRGASHLAAAVGISPLIVGLTIVSFGTSAPEIAVGVTASSSGSSDLALGNVVGSNLANTLAILGLAALVTPLIVHQKLVKREVPLVLVATIVVWLMARSGDGITRVEGSLLAAAVVAYVAWAVVVERREPPEVLAEYEHEYADDGGRHWALDIGLMVAGLVLLVVGSTWLVDGAVRIAEALGLSELVIGLTIVAIGTSAPEGATSIVAGLRGERDIAVGNIVGSNLFNLLAVLGFSAIASPVGLPAPTSVVDFDLPVLIAVAALCTAVFFTGWIIERWEGALFVLLYAAYVTYLLLDVGETTSPDRLGTVLAVALPLIAIVVIVDVVAKVRRGNPPVLVDEPAAPSEP